MCHCKVHIKNKMYFAFRNGVKQNKKVLIFIVLVVITFIYYILNSQHWVWYMNDTTGKAPICVTPEIQMDDLKELIIDLHGILREFNLTHVLIYGR